MVWQPGKSLKKRSGQRLRRTSRRNGAKATVVQGADGLKVQDQPPGVHIFTLSEMNAVRPAPGEYMGWALPDGQKKLSYQT